MKIVLIAIVLALTTLSAQAELACTDRRIELIKIFVQARDHGTSESTTQ
jgi:hypothetical protein